MTGPIFMLNEMGTKGMVRKEIQNELLSMCNVINYQ